MEINNKFSIEDINLEEFSYPQIKVVAWSNLFGGEDREIGEMRIQTTGDELYRGIVFHREPIYKGDNQQVIKEELEEMAKEWNKDCEENWKLELKRCFEELAKYEQSQLDKIEERKENLEKYKSAIRKLEQATNKD